MSTEFCRGPTIYFREMFSKHYKQDKYYGITLNPHSKEIPGWSKANSLIRQFKKNIEIEDVRYLINMSGDYKSDALVNECLCGNISQYKKITVITIRK